ncbi:MAG: hypothetical protein QGG42_07590 [Phycisphaerae bacterium]|jgi:hypothetical protein|nr:hypothetical protein [Phycisphaerae bacterium]
MKWYRVVGLVALPLVVLCGGVLAAAPEFRPGVRLQADGKDINVRVGHLVPAVMDWNGDGKKDLIVGQFSGGRISVYLNKGSDKVPAFKDFSLLRADTKEIRLPAG